MALRAPHVQRLGQLLLADARLTLDDQRHVGDCQPRAERIEPPHRLTGAEGGAKAVEIGRCRQGARLAATDLQRGGADADDLPPHEIGFHDRDTVDHRAVGRAEVANSQAMADDLDRGVPARDGGIRESHVADLALAEQDARWMRRDDLEAPTGIGTLDGRQREARRASFDHAGGPRHRGLIGKRIVVAHRGTALFR
jgi:hypothetical protein